MNPQGSHWKQGRVRNRRGTEWCFSVQISKLVQRGCDTLEEMQALDSYCWSCSLSSATSSSKASSKFLNHSTPQLSHMFKKSWWSIWGGASAPVAPGLWCPRAGVWERPLRSAHGRRLVPRWQAISLSPAQALRSSLLSWPRGSLALGAGGL